jgi:hypothetical protein
MRFGQLSDSVVTETVQADGKPLHTCFRPLIGYLHLGDSSGQPGANFKPPAALHLDRI